jgi:alkylated DNA repair dioxygenase AlkB
MKLPTLFHEKIEPKNIIPHGGEAIYHGVIFDEAFADRVFEMLLRTTVWKNDEGIIYDKEYKTARKVAWYSSRREWPRELLAMKKTIEGITGVTYRNVLLNLYESGEVGLGWHADKESLEEDSSIASVSLGAERRFDFRNIETKETISIVLEHGSLLVMQGLLQNFWKHQLPKSKRVHHPRINLTFRR